jgi:cyclase
LLPAAPAAGVAGAESWVEEGMLCRRVVMLLTFCDGVLHRTKRFVPDYRYTAQLLGNRNADEVVIIDVTPAERRAEQRHLFYAALQRYAETCFSPITVGGGIRTLEEIRFLISECSADKVVIGSYALKGDLPLWHSAVSRFGAQALVMAINHDEHDDVKWVTWFATTPSKKGAIGEILLNSVDRDGSLQGYDLGMLMAVSGLCDVPIMVAGGCGTWRHMADAFDAGADAACTSVIHHFTETSLAACKRWLAQNCKQPVRAVA